MVDDHALVGLYSGKFELEGNLLEHAWRLIIGLFETSYPAYKVINRLTLEDVTKGAS